MKRITVFSVCLLILLSLTGCSNKDKVPIALPTAIELDANEAYEKLREFTINDIKDMWGDPDDGIMDGCVWSLNGKRIIVSYNLFGMISNVKIESIINETPQEMCDGVPLAPEGFGK